MDNVVTSRVAYVTSAILPTRNVDVTSLPIARIVLILKAELFCGPQLVGQDIDEILGFTAIGPHAGEILAVL